MASTYDPQQLVTDPFLGALLLNCDATRSSTIALLDRSADAPTSDEEAYEIDEQQKILLARVAKLRGQNRQLAYSVRNTKTETSTARSEVDRLHLQLQNLYYEQKHLIGEIAACDNFDHSYMRLPVISLEEFFERYPEWREEGRVDENGEGSGEVELMKARIKEEQRERLELEEQRQTLLKRKLELVKENAKRKEELNQLDMDLTKFIEAAQPIEKLFEKDN